MDTSKPVYLTAKGLQKLNDELEFLRIVRRMEIAEALHETQSGGDNIDNTEYQAILYQQLLLEMRISELHRLVAGAQLIVPGSRDGVARLGSTVVIEDDARELRTYMIVGSAEADPDEGRISDECPLGQAVLSHRAGDCVEVQAPDGLIIYRIIAVN